MPESALRDYPWSGIAILAFGAFTMLADVALGVYGVVVESPALIVFAAFVLLWVLLLWLMVFSGVREEWPR